MCNVAAGGRIERADAAARLHRIRNDPVIAEIEPCDVSCRLKRDIGRPSVADRPVQADVVRIAPVQGILYLRLCRQRGIVDIDLFGRIERLRLGLRDHQGDGIADIADPILRERVLRREVKRFARVDVDLLVGLQRPDPAAGQIVAGQDRDDAWRSFGGRGIDRPDIRMRVR